jgi:hypothetical protein
VDHIIVFGEIHLRRILKSYADYYKCRSGAESSELFRKLF